VNVPAEIFRAYDIRGIAARCSRRGGARDRTRARQLGRERGAPVSRSAATAGFQPGAVGALMDGLNAAGADVIDIGIVPTPVTYLPPTTSAAAAP
jgi:phosphomannomutase/phosphoglucomutase